MRSLLKRLIERAASATGVPQRAIRRTAAPGAILAYHNVIPDAEAGRGDRSLHLPLSTFRAQMDVVQEYTRVAPLVELLASRGPEPEQPLRVAITFDDAYRGAVELGLSELAERGLPATVFVAPGFLGGRDFWWDALATDDNGGLTEEIRDTALEELAGDDESIRAWARRQGLKVNQVPEVMRCVTESELGDARVRGTVTVASHTWSHRNLGRLAPDQLQQDISKTADWVREAGGDMTAVAYPYGIPPGDSTGLGSHGHTFGLLVHGGRLPSSPDRWAIPRINVPAGLSPEGLLLRLAGWR